MRSQFSLMWLLGATRPSGSIDATPWASPRGRTRWNQPRDLLQNQLAPGDDILGRPVLLELGDSKWVITPNSPSVLLNSYQSPRSSSPPSRKRCRVDHLEHAYPSTPRPHSSTSGQVPDRELSQLIQEGLILEERGPLADGAIAHVQNRSGEHPAGQLDVDA